MEKPLIHLPAIKTDPESLQRVLERIETLLEVQGAVITLQPAEIAVVYRALTGQMGEE